MKMLGASLLLILSVATWGWCFLGTVRRYRTLRGFPWLLSLAMAAASIAGIYAIYILLHS